MAPAPRTQSSGLVVDLWLLTFALWLYERQADPRTTDMPVDSHFGHTFVLGLLMNDQQVKNDEKAWIIDVCNPTKNTTIVVLRIFKSIHNWSSGAVNGYGILELPSLQVDAAKTGSVILGGYHLRTTSIGHSLGILYMYSQTPIAVFATNLGKGVETILAIPVTGFENEYTIITTNGNGALMVIGSEGGTEVSLALRDTKSAQRVWSTFSNYTYRDGYNIYSPGGSLTFYFFVPYNSFQFHICYTRVYDTDFTGYLIKATKPVGVIAGNCQAAVDNAGQGNHYEEMQLGMDFWGYRFVMAGPDHDSTYGVRIVYSRQTNVTISRNSAAPTHLPNADPATFLEFSLHRNEIVYLKSSAPIQVAMLWPTEVKIGIKGALMLIPPMENWLYFYMIRTNLFSHTKTGEYFQIHFLAFPSIEVGLRLNNNFLDDKVLRLQEGMFVRRTAIIVKDVANIDGYRLDHVAGVRFGAYVTDISEKSSMAYPAGMAFRRLEREIGACPLKQTMEPGDEVDNDCDGLIDEELSNNRSDDSDDLVDEDLSMYPGVQSQYERPVSVSVPFSDNTTEYDTTASVLYENTTSMPLPADKGRSRTESNTSGFQIGHLFWALPLIALAIAATYLYSIKHRSWRSHKDDHQLGEDYALYQHEQRSMMSQQTESMGQSEDVEEMEMIEYESSIH